MRTARGGGVICQVNLRGVLRIDRCPRIASVSAAAICAAWRDPVRPGDHARDRVGAAFGPERWPWPERPPLSRQRAPRSS